jgi:hypothetical protein
MIFDCHINNNSVVSFVQRNPHPEEKLVWASALKTSNNLPYLLRLCPKTGGRARPTTLGHFVSCLRFRSEHSQPTSLSTSLYDNMIIWYIGNRGEMRQLTKIRKRFGQLAYLQLLIFSGVIPNLSSTVQVLTGQDPASHHSDIKSNSLGPTS